MKKFLLGTAVLIATIAGYFTFADYSNGQRAGQVVKFSYKGTIPGCKTWEGELVLGGLRGQSAVDDSGANIFRFTASSNAVIEKIQHKLETGEHALLTYREPYWNAPCTTATGYFVTEVK